MRSMRIIPFLLGIIISILVTGNVTAKEEEGLEVGNIAPDFGMKTLNGKTIKLSDFRGEKVMINFWATWCPPCRTEMPDMQKLHKNNDVVVLAVNLTDTETNKKNVRTFVEDFDLTFQVGLDGDGAVSTAYRINPIPTTFMIDSRGKIGHKVYGAMEYETMIEELEKME